MGRSLKRAVDAFTHLPSLGAASAAVTKGLDTQAATATPRAPATTAAAGPAKLDEGLIPASQANPTTWMGQSVSKSTSLANVTLPGTHDSAATKNLGLPGSADAQRMSLKEQLDSGVRFLDLRFKLEPAKRDPRTGRELSPEHLQVYHGISRQPLSGEEALRTVSDFLRDHPGEAQGKIVLMRRYAAPNGNTAAPLGIDATAGWPNGTSAPTGVTANKLLHVEDHYNNFDGAGTDQEEKWRDVQQALEHAGTHADPGVMHVSFASATNTSPFGNPTWQAIPSFSDPINRQLTDYAGQHRGGVGVVAVDRADPELIRSLINMNG